MSDLQALKAEQFGLQARAYECDQLIDFLEAGDHQLDLSADMATVAEAALRVLTQAITNRINEIDNVIEFENNQAMDRFRRREIR